MKYDIWKTTEPKEHKSPLHHPKILTSWKGVTVLYLWKVKNNLQLLNSYMIFLSFTSQLQGTSTSWSTNIPPWHLARSYVAWCKLAKVKHWEVLIMSNIGKKCCSEAKKDKIYKANHNNQLISS